ncbi:MAG: ABC transporter ATP-binding protein [Chloroflexota bacterium]|nr:branched-chain amino acid ABC transporter permease [Chloroflexota bacterium]NOG63424.1 branched-chain amino acid ABC transporter permease [Chloroflexota bacterium]GIK62283.1 MAG: ABC transporter ATP-binding protein [Chloroflexota bacterium]
MRDILAQPRSMFSGRLRWVLIAIIVVIAPFAMKELELLTNFGLITQVNRALIFVALAQGLNIVVGLAGLLDLGYAAFFAIGAYTFGLLTWPSHDIEMSFFLAIWICALVAAVFGIIIGAPTLRLRGDYLAIVTLAFGEIIPALVRNLGDFTLTFRGRVLIEDYNLTNGSQGLTPLGRPDFSFLENLFGLDKGAFNVGVDPTFWYFAIVITSMIVLFSAIRLNNSRLGRAWKAIREDETAADFMGVDPIRTKLAAFAIGASFSGLAGAVYASMLGAIFPELFKFQVSIFLLIIVVLSGRGSIWGVLIGGIIIATFDGVFLAQVLPDIFNGELLPEYDVQSLRWVFFGIGLIVIMIFRPQGLFPPKSIETKIVPPTTESAEGAPNS